MKSIATVIPALNTVLQVLRVRNILETIVNLGIQFYLYTKKALHQFRGITKLRIDVGGSFEHIDTTRK